MDSILLIRLSSLGDVILATGLVRQISTSLPDVAIDVAVDARFADVWLHNPRVRAVYPIERAVRTNQQLQEQAVLAPYDHVVDLQRSSRSKDLLRSLRLPKTTAVSYVDKHRLEKLLLVWLKRRPERVTSVAERYWKTVEHLGVAFDDGGPEIWTQQDASGERRERVSIGIAPGARHKTKRWTQDGFAQLVRQLVQEHQEQVILLGGMDDVDLCSEIDQLANVGVVRSDGARDLATTVEAIDGCRLVITNDSALMHLARARSIPVVAIFGSTVVELGFAPRGADVRIVERSDVQCRPCSHIGRDSCPKGHHQCMTLITPDQVLAAAEYVIALRA
ncbi:MAG: hypothetical protein RL594_856 [Bacteroidota bacterium]|jgi:ADP-heptose:LPS heptosyltransferase